MNISLPDIRTANATELFTQPLGMALQAFHVGLNAMRNYLHSNDL